MGTHLIPRANVKGQDRLFIIFSFQGLIGTLIGAAIGIPFWYIGNMMGGPLVGATFVFIFGMIGFIIGQVKVPDNNGSPLFKKVGGLYIRDVIISFFKFRANKKKYILQVSDDDVFEEHQETKLEKLVLNRAEDANKNTGVTN